MSDDYDEIDYLIENDPIVLGRRCRTAERDRDVAVAALEAIAAVLEAARP